MTSAGHDEPLSEPATFLPLGTTGPQDCRRGCYTPDHESVRCPHREPQSLQPPVDRPRHAHADHRHPYLRRVRRPARTVPALRVVLDGLRDLESQVIYVNDGSTDGSLEIMLDEQRQDSRFTVIDLSRNFGQQAAIAAGLAASTADATIVMDGDLQDPPS